MTTRFDANVRTGLQSGYNNTNVSTLSIPSCGIEDVDFAIFHLFDKELKLVVTSENTTVPVHTIFAAGEKWANIKKKREIRDKNDRLILPIVTIGRTSVTQNIKDDITGRGINQQTGELVIKRRLMSNDRGYQNLINRLFLQHQNNVAINQGTLEINQDQQLMTQREIGDLSEDDLDVQDGGLLLPKKDKNIWEIITIPTPQFFSVEYEIIVWTQYITHMNQILEALLAAQLPQGNAYKIANPNKPDYWFIAKFTDNNTLKPNNNWDDMFEQERIIKYEFSMTVPAYILATNVPGAPVPVRRHVSCAKIEFKTETTDDLANVQVDTNAFNTTVEPWLGADDPTLPYDHVNPTRLHRDDGRFTGAPRLNDQNAVYNEDPALLNKKRGQSLSKYIKLRTVDSQGNVKYKRVQVKNINKSTGESVINAGDFVLDGISFVSDK